MCRCHAVGGAAEEPVFYDLVGMMKSNMVVVKSTYLINELGDLSTTSRG